MTYEMHVLNPASQAQMQGYLFFCATLGGDHQNIVLIAKP